MSGLDNSEPSGFSRTCMRYQDLLEPMSFDITERPVDLCFVIGVEKRRTEAQSTRLVNHRRAPS